ncbi:hypothetical protein V9L05_02530 [Bernardetia sp. Wsw4-3y2]|uniref:hypothetical protein n=1 Tax=Bernardetia sp. Wsw4-3y2 TaxID=3127471 RepID=UPI0030CE2F1B
MAFNRSTSFCKSTTFLLSDSVEIVLVATVVSETIMLDLKNNQENQQIKDLERRLKLPLTDNDSINSDDIRIIGEFDLLIYIYIKSVKETASSFDRNIIGKKVSSLFPRPKELEEKDPKQNELNTMIVKLFLYSYYRVYFKQINFKILILPLCSVIHKNTNK